MRASGILLPVFSLPGKYGIGCFSVHAYRFIDKLAAAGQKYWQILPLAHAGGWYSPYQPLSCFATDPVYIDVENLIDEGLLKKEDTAALESAAEKTQENKICYDELVPAKMQVLKKAYTCSEKNNDATFRSFCKENESWLNDYSLFFSLSKRFGTPNWSRWPKQFRYRDEDSLREFAEKNSEEIRFIRWLQYKAAGQWKAVRRYAHSKNVDIIGDIPIYAAYESADCWACPELFKLNKSLKPTAVSGCPPDGFSETGQVWGNPLYKWTYHKKTGYRWWISRLERNFRMYDVIRLDHMRGFESFFSIPAKDDTAENGHWMKGPGISFFDAVKKAVPGARFIAEDLGYITPAVHKLIEKTGLPGMKVLQFAFDMNPQNPYLPENYEKNCIVYSGTHDNDTTTGWYLSLSKEQKRGVTAYLRGINGKQPENSKKAPEFGPNAAVRSLVALAMRSRADTCIIPVQDYLLYGTEARINVPGTTGDNWSWRIAENALSDDLVSYILSLTKEAGRCSI